MSGHVGDLSRTQEEALRQFREAVAEIPNKPEEDDYYYLRWLRARKFNVKKAEEMFRKVRTILLVIEHYYDSQLWIIIIIIGLSI